MNYSGYEYPLTLTPDSGGYVVTLKDFPGVITEGDTLEEALEMAQDALNVMAEVYIEKGLEFPKPSKAGRDQHTVAIHLEAPKQRAVA